MSTFSVSANICPMAFMALFLPAGSVTVLARRRKPTWSASILMNTKQFRTFFSSFSNFSSCSDNVHRSYVLLQFLSLQSREGGLLLHRLWGPLRGRRLQIKIIIRKVSTRLNALNKKDYWNRRCFWNLLQEEQGSFFLPVAVPHGKAGKRGLYDNLNKCNKF